MSLQSLKRRVSRLKHWGRCGVTCTVDELDPLVNQLEALAQGPLLARRAKEALQNNDYEGCKNFLNQIEQLR